MDKGWGGTFVIGAIASVALAGTIWLSAAESRGGGLGAAAVEFGGGHGLASSDGPLPAVGHGLVSSLIGPTSDSDPWKPFQGAANNPLLRSLENVDKVRGVILFDPSRQWLVLEHAVGDGHVVPLLLDPAASSELRLVFAGVGSTAGSIRVTYERSGGNDLVERVEHAPPGREFEVVSETRLTREN